MPSRRLFELTEPASHQRLLSWYFAYFRNLTKIASLATET